MNDLIDEARRTTCKDGGCPVTMVRWKLITALETLEGEKRELNRSEGRAWERQRDERLRAEKAEARTAEQGTIAVDLLARCKELGEAAEAAEQEKRDATEVAETLAEHYSNLKRDFRLGIKLATRSLEAERDRLRVALREALDWLKLCADAAHSEGCSSIQESEDFKRLKAALTPEPEEVRDPEQPDWAQDISAEDLRKVLRQDTTE